MSDWSIHNAPQPLPQDNQKILFHTCIKTEVIELNCLTYQTKSALHLIWKLETSTLKYTSLVETTVISKYLLDFFREFHQVIFNTRNTKSLCVENTACLKSREDELI